MRTGGSPCVQPTAQTGVFEGRKAEPIRLVAVAMLATSTDANWLQPSPILVDAPTPTKGVLTKCSLKGKKDEKTCCHRRASTIVPLKTALKFHPGRAHGVGRVPGAEALGNPRQPHQQEEDPVRIRLFPDRLAILTDPCDSAEPRIPLARLLPLW